MYIHGKNLRSMLVSEIALDLKSHAFLSEGGK